MKDKLVGVLINISPEQKKLLAELSGLTKMSQSALARQALAMLFGGYKDVLKKQ